MNCPQKQFRTLGENHGRTNLTKTEGGVIAAAVNQIPEPEPGTIHALPSDPGDNARPFTA